MMKTPMGFISVFLAVLVLVDSAPKKPDKVQTLAFFDLETTGLIEYNKTAPRIIEYSIVTIGTNDFIKSIKETQENNANGQPKSDIHSDYIDYSLTKNQSQLIDPEMSIPEIVSNLTKITQEMVTGQKKFFQFAPDMWNFLLTKPKPIVMIAHNGARFDFKVLMTELINANSLEGISQVYTSDSIYVFKAIDKEWNKTKNVNSQSLTPGKSKLLNYLDRLESGQETVFNYKLASLHQRFFDGLLPPGHHGALADCFSLMQVAAQYGEDFVNEVKKKMKLLSEILPVGEKKPVKKPSPAA